MSNIYYAATAKNGIFQIDPANYPELRVMDVRDFVTSSSNLDESKIIFTVAEQGGWDYLELDSLAA